MHDCILHCINLILFKREIYPSNKFTPLDYNRERVMSLRNLKLIPYLTGVMEYVEKWLLKQKVWTVSLLLQILDMKKTIEGWDFTIESLFKNDLVLPKINQMCTFELFVLMNDNV
uniref:HORMA domain-containing protein n=1 Tax=Anopheles dirus TaxID=7168 RepID=A0A182NPX3_9DIPT